MRILHLLETEASRRFPEGALAAIASLRHHDENEHLTIGFGPAQAAHGAGVALDSRLSVPPVRMRSALRALNRVIDSLGPIDRVQPWSAATAGLVSRLEQAEPLPPPTASGPILGEHCDADARCAWRERFAIAEDEIAVTLIDLDRHSSSTGEFGLAIAPLSCAFQDRTLVGIIPATAEEDGAVRARRYARMAGERWRIELISAPSYAASIAANVVLQPLRPTRFDPWAMHSNAAYALACAQACSIPVVEGSFTPMPVATRRSNHLITPRKAGYVGVITALHESLIRTDETREVIRSAEKIARGRLDPLEWIERWRRSLGLAALR